MQNPIAPEWRAPWSAWADFLRRHGLESMAIWALEAIGPLAVLGAQVLIFGGPLLRPAVSSYNLEALSHLLEDTDEARAFADYLKEEQSL